MRAGKESFFFGRLNLALKKYFGGLAFGQSHEAHAFFEVALAGQERKSFCPAPTKAEEKV